MGSQPFKIVLASIISAIIIVGVCVYFLQQISIVKNTNLVNNNSQQLVVPTDTSEVEKLKDQLAEARVRLAIVSWYGSEPGEIFRNPLNKNLFVFLQKIQSAGRPVVNIGIYDLKKDEQYNFSDLPEVEMAGDSGASKYFYFETLAEEHVIYAAGMDGNKLVLWETGVDNSPGPCYSTWQADNLTYVDVADKMPSRKPYNAPQIKLDQAQNEVKQCEEEMDNRL